MPAENSVTTLVKFLSLLISEIITIDKNQDKNVTVLEVLGTTMTVLAKAYDLVYVFNNIGEDFKVIKNILGDDTDAFDKIVDEITALDFLPDDRDLIEDAVKKTLIALLYCYDAGLAWVATGAGNKENVIVPAIDLKKTLNIAS